MGPIGPGQGELQGLQTCLCLLAPAFKAYMQVLPCGLQEFLASTVNLALLEREEVCMKAFAKLDKVG